MDTNRLHLHSAKETFKIVSGPSKDRLVDAFKYAYDNTTSIPVSFVVSLDKSAKITSSRCVWMIFASPVFSTKMALGVLST